MASHRTKVFISYCHQDRAWLERLRVHLRPMERAGIVRRWDDTVLKGGQNWRDEIRKALESTKVAVLLVSADFLASDFIAANELPPLIAAAEAEEVIILPVILSACSFGNNELARFQAINDPARPLAAMEQAESEQVFNEVVQRVKEALSPDSVTSTSISNELSEVPRLSSLALDYRAQNRYRDAEKLYKHVLQICEHALGSYHPEVAISLNNLAELYCAAGNYDKAAQRFQRALAIQEKVLGSEHLDLATTLNNLAVLYDTQGGRYSDAEQLYLRALQIREKALGSNHQAVAIILNNLADLYCAWDKPLVAELLLKRCLKIKQKRLEPKDFSVARTLNSLALVYRKLGRQEAESLFRQALAIKEKALGSEHANLAITLTALAELLHHLESKRTEAERLYKRALTTLEKAVGPTHPDVAIVLGNYANLLRKIGRADEAELLDTRANDIRTSVHAPFTRSVAGFLTRIFPTSCAMGW